mmetsp:Transcript_15682/g.13381  ORF Transcript_15682/g.13381 Transcript_15682/m.13381 type:complete len:282 (+) Transcript_15682:82-927(+)|eukprot:CAMPEP_0114586452 /NCGR_PEP_ID=MMETSP0125-20121206/9674_1 /TAXON_ID=485358 ORGANISM="Aristerostoma sp., Strain ATCC 50986" /NCGR_SAMPLE_ID=MMETSP0125 /ASSEMBLY_ACC=CAM_ASM_000245 /LENGTH=281 /DNA_ID=CAMNT_0001781901 /DNA_START=67 /DNA_END=912 /DNA_ORIENTATION=+
MDVESNQLIQVDRPTVVRKVDIYGQPSDGKTSFDHREESEPVGNFLAQMRIDSISLWFLRTDNQNVALQGICTSYKKLNEDNFFESFESVDDKIKNSDRDYDIVHFDDGEYIREINVTTASANQKVGAIEFVTTNKGRKVLAYGSTNANAEDGKQSEPLPPGDTKKFDFLKGEGDNFPGYVVGFYGQYDENHITYLGVYVAPLTEINYYARRPYILTFKKMQNDKALIAEVAKNLSVERDNERFKDANLEDTDGNSSKILLYFLDASLQHPELFKAVLEYL